MSFEWRSREANSVEFVNFSVMQVKQSNRQFAFALRFVNVSLSEYRALRSTLTRKSEQCLPT